MSSTAAPDRRMSIAAHTSDSAPLPPRREFTAILDHRWVGDAIEVQIQWLTAVTWEPERNLHRDSKAALLSYWRRQPNGRPLNPRDSELFNVFQFRDAKVEVVDGQEQPFLLVEWVGYGEDMMTWEPEEAMILAAPDLYRNFWRNRGNV